MLGKNLFLALRGYDMSDFNSPEEIDRAHKNYLYLGIEPTEAAYGGYQRQTGLDFKEAPRQTFSIENKTAITFPEATSGKWLLTEYELIFNSDDDVTISRGKLSQPIVVQSGITLEFAPGKLRIEL